VSDANQHGNRPARRKRLDGAGRPGDSGRQPAISVNVNGQTYAGAYETRLSGEDHSPQIR
jgi:hypothetical protein